MGKQRISQHENYSLYGSVTSNKVIKKVSIYDRVLKIRKNIFYSLNIFLGSIWTKILKIKFISVIFFIKV